MTPDEQRISDAATGDNWRYRAMRAEIAKLRAALVEICDPTLSPFEMRAVAAGALGWDGPSRSSTL